MPLCVLTDQKCQPQVRKMLDQAFMPARRALGTGWVVTAILSSPRITKSHRKNCDLRFIEEDQTIQPQPVTQAIAARIIPRYSGPVDLAPWRLINDQKPGVLANCTTGRGPSGSSASQIRQARTSRNMRFSDIQKLSA